MSSLVAPGVDALSADRVKQLVDHDPNVLVIDVRTSGEIERDGAIKGFVHIPLSRLDKRLGGIPKGKNIIVVCSHGARSARGAAILESHGFKKVHSAAMLDWQARGYPLVHPKLPR